MPEQSLKSKAVKGVAWSTVNTVSSLIIGFLVGIILARKLMPSDFGAVAMVGVFTSILSMFTDGGLTMALVRKENRTETDKCTVFYYNFIACYTVYGIMFFIAPWIAEFYNMPILCKLARMSSLTLLICPFASMQSLHFTVNINYKIPALISINTCIMNAVLSIWMAYNGYGVWSLVIPSIFISIIRIIVMISIVRWYPTKRFSMESFRELFGYSSKLLASWTLNRIYNNITPLIVGKFFSSAQLGLYEKAKSWPSLPSQTFTNVLESVTFPVLSKMQHDLEYLAINYRRMLRLSVFIVFPMMVGLAAVARPLTIVLVTDKWIDSVILMQLICFSMMWYPVHALNGNILVVTGRSGYVLRLEIVKKIIGLTVMCCSLPFGLVTFCAAGILSSLLCLLVNTYYTERIIHLGILKQMRDIIPIFVNSCIMGLICLLVQALINDNVWKLIVAIPCGIVYYAVSSMVLNKEELKELIDIIKRR